MGSLNIFLVLIIIYFLIMAFIYFIYLWNRNIYTQKIIYLNNQLSNVDDIKKFRIKKDIEFSISKEGDLKYPPEVIDEYMVNQNYYQIVKRFDFIKKRTKKYYYYITLLFLLSLFLIIIFGPYSYDDIVKYLKDELSKPPVYD